MARQESTIYDVLRSIIYQDAQMCLELMRLSQELMALITAAAPQRKAGEVSDGVHNNQVQRKCRKGRESRLTQRIKLLLPQAAQAHCQPPPTRQCSWRF